MHRYEFDNWRIYNISVVYKTQVNYLHSHGLAHTELRLENVHISPVDRHIKVSTRFSCMLSEYNKFFLAFIITSVILS